MRLATLFLWYNFDSGEEFNWDNDRKEFVWFIAGNSKKEKLAYNFHPLEENWAVFGHLRPKLDAWMQENEIVINHVEFYGKEYLRVDSPGDPCDYDENEKPIPLMHFKRGVPEKCVTLTIVSEQLGEWYPNYNYYFELEGVEGLLKEDAVNKYLQEHKLGINRLEYKKIKELKPKEKAKLLKK